MSLADLGAMQLVPKLMRRKVPLAALGTLGRHPSHLLADVHVAPLFLHGVLQPQPANLTADGCNEMRTCSHGHHGRPPLIPYGTIRAR